MLTVPSEIKDLLHEDTCKKNIRIHFPNGERSDICNDLIVMDSVKFTESLCSQNELKFGLCESPVFECEVVGVGNIKGASIEVTCEIYCPSTVSGAVYRPDLNDYVYPLPYGTFTVQEAKRQADMNHRRIQAYGDGNVSMNNCPIIKFASDVLYLDNSAYDPRVIPLIIMASGATGKIPGLTYTELSWESSDFLYPTKTYYESGGSHAIRGYGMACKAYRYYESVRDDELYYIEYDEPNVSAAELGHGVTSDDFYGGITRKEGTRNANMRANKYLYRHKGKYIYPYQAIFNLYDADESYSDNLIFVPYKYVSHMGSSNYGNWGQWYPGGGSQQIQFRSIPKIYKVDISGYPQDRLSIARTVKKQKYTPVFYSWDYNSVDFIKLFNGQLELEGLIGRVGRNNVDFINVQRQFGLRPSGTLYPGNSTYPQGVTGGKLLPEDYQSCWYEDEYTKPYGAITCTYKNTSNEDSIFTLYLTGFDQDIDSDTYKVYDFSDNELIKEKTWTSSQIEDICNQIASNIEGVSYMPVDFVGRGLPYVEAGDTFEILTKSNDSITTIVLNRTISGEQVLTDSYKSV